MPGLHLTRVPYDLFVCDFPYVPSYVASGYSVFYGLSATKWVRTETARRSYRNRAVSAASARARAAYVWRLRGDGTVRM